MYAQIIAGAITGLGYAIAGWKKQTDKKEKEFQWPKLGKSVIVCGIVGGAAGYMNADFSVLLTGATGIGVTKAVDLVWKLVKKYILKK